MSIIVAHNTINCKSNFLILDTKRKRTKQKGGILLGCGVLVGRVILLYFSASVLLYTIGLMCEIYLYKASNFSVNKNV